MIKAEQCTLPKVSIVLIRLWEPLNYLRDIRYYFEISGVLKGENSWMVWFLFYEFQNKKWFTINFWISVHILSKYLWTNMTMKEMCKINVVSRNQAKNLLVPSHNLLPQRCMWYSFHLKLDNRRATCKRQGQNSRCTSSSLKMRTFFNENQIQ